VTSPPPPTTSGPGPVCAATSNSGVRNSSISIRVTEAAAQAAWASNTISACPRFGVPGTVNRASNPPAGSNRGAARPDLVALRVHDLVDTPVTAPASPPTSPLRA